MKKTWFNRLLLSYLPIFIMTIMIFTLTVAFFLYFGQISKQEAEKANEMFAQQIIQSMDYSLKMIDKSIMYEIQTNDKLHLFFEPDNKTNPYFSAYEVSQMIKSIIYYNPLIESIYVYRPGSDAVLTQDRMFTMNEFDDKAILLERNRRDASYYWINREMKSRSMVSLVRKIPLISGGDGVIVINVCSCSIQRMVDDLSTYKTSYVNLVDQEGNNIFETPRAENYVQLSHVRSNYTGWEIKSGIQNGKTVNVIYTFSYLFVAIGLGMLVVGGGWAIRSVWRNYHPVEKIISRIKGYSLQKEDVFSSKHDQDELEFIETSIGRLMEQSIQYRELHAQDLIFRRSHFYNEIISGHRTFSLDSWKEEMEILGLEWRFDKLHFATVEIDKYVEFSDKNSSEDQKLLKLVLLNMLNETAANHALTVWCEWMDYNQLNVMCQLNEDISEATIDNLYESIRTWVQRNLHFTVTIGMSSFVEDVNDIHNAYALSLECLNYKTVLGTNRLIRKNALPPKKEDELYKRMSTIRNFSQFYRLGDERWIKELDRMFSEMKHNWISRQEIVTVINYLIMQMSKDMDELSRDLQDIWNNDALPQMRELVERCDTVGEIQTRMLVILFHTSDRMAVFREHRVQHRLAQEVRSYIETNFAKPDLSLSMLSKQFSINPNQLSRIFKEEFGENFVDFLAGVRIVKAKELLLTTSEPINEIANNVGYNHSLSFIRVFKKLTDVTPGKYRNTGV